MLLALLVSLSPPLLVSTSPVFRLCACGGAAVISQSIKRRPPFWNGIKLATPQSRTLIWQTELLANAAIVQPRQGRP